MTTRPIDLDHNATTPIDPRVADAMLPYLRDQHGNPSSSHALGRSARAAVERARGHVADLLGAAPEEIVFTSGGSEANTMAIAGTARRRVDRGHHVVTSAVEHPAVLEPCRALEAGGHEVTVLPVDRMGRVAAADAERALRDDTVLVSVMLANNEVGTLQPVAAIAEACRRRDVWLHTDAAQAMGKVPVDVEALGVDLLTVAAHKFYGPKGVGALYIRRGREIPALILGAGHEAGRRAGTENVLGIVGLGEAARLAGLELADDMRRNRRLRDRLHRRLQAGVDDLHVHGDLEGGLPNTLSASAPGVDAASLLADVGDRLAASAGAACHADGVSMSSVLAAMGVSPELAMGTMRFSVGRSTTERDVDEAADIVVTAVRARRGRA